MDIKRSPLLTSFEVRRAAGMNITNSDIRVAQVTPDIARLVAHLTYEQQTPQGIQTVPVLADLFATGAEGSFSGRALRAEITSTDRSMPFSYTFEVEETPTALSYVVRRIRGTDLSRTYDDPRRTDYRFREPLRAPRQITPEDLAQFDHKQTLVLNQIMTAAILKITGAPLLEPNSDQ